MSGSDVGGRWTKKGVSITTDAVTVGTGKQAKEMGWYISWNCVRDSCVV
jgi:hypothetical protein